MLVHNKSSCSSSPDHDALLACLWLAFSFRRQIDKEKDQIGEVEQGRRSRVRIAALRESASSDPQGDAGSQEEEEAKANLSLAKFM